MMRPIGGDDQGPALAHERIGRDDEPRPSSVKGVPPDDASSSLDEQRAATRSGRSPRHRTTHRGTGRNASTSMTRSRPARGLGEVPSPNSCAIPTAATATTRARREFLACKERREHPPQGVARRARAAGSRW